MDVVERCITSFKRASRLFNIPLTSLSNPLNGKIRFQNIDPLGVLSNEKEVIVDWILGMQAWKLSITQQQLKFKMVEFT
jgi:hypothetical protein